MYNVYMMYSTCTCSCVYSIHYFLVHKCTFCQIPIFNFLACSFGSEIFEFQPPNGRKSLEGLRNCKGTHHARHLHMTKPSQVTFHGHHFRAVMGFIMNGLAPRLDNDIHCTHQVHAQCT